MEAPALERDDVIDDIAGAGASGFSRRGARESLELE
jgi:hypothetical protein